MSDSAASGPGQSHSLGFFNYLDPGIASSLYRNGKVLMRRLPDGSDADMQGVTTRRRKMPVYDGRDACAENRPSIASNGFELLDRPVQRRGLDFLDHAQVVRHYYPRCAEIVEQATGAKTFAFDHNVRSAGGGQKQRKVTGGQAVQQPVHFVHGDYTLTSAPQRLRDLARPPGTNDTLKSVLGGGESLLSPQAVAKALADGGRFALINLWRNIAAQPVATHPLALCDSQTVAPEDLVVFEIHYQDRVGENYFAKHADRHRWFYFPEMASSEALLIKQWDSAGPLARSQGKAGDASDANAPCTFSFHSAFEDPATPGDAPDRQSIEVRCIVIYDSP